MKKALVVFLMLALVSSVFAAEPVADVKIAEFSGNASVQWGVNLDSGKTGFKNAYEVVFKLNLLNNGTKSTTGDGVWGELVLKTDGDTFIGWKNTSYGDDAKQSAEGMGKDLQLKTFVDVAKIHLGPAYIGIKSGDTRTGSLKMDAAIRSADNDNAFIPVVSNEDNKTYNYLHDVGPKGFSQGIVAGFANDMFGIDVDLRSYEAATQYSNAYAFAAEAEFKGVENLSVKAGASYNFSDKYYNDDASSVKTSLANVMGYSASAGYKLALNDTYYIRPQVGFTGTNSTQTVASVETKSNSMDMAFGVLFGWGEIGMDKNADVPFLDNDGAKKVSPGVSIHAAMPLAAKTGDTDYLKDGRAIVLRPAFFSGEIVKNLTVAALADIVLPVGYDNNPDPMFGMVFGVKYAIAVDAITVTPNFGVRFANKEYAAYAKAVVAENNESLITRDWYDGTTEKNAAINGSVDGIMNIKAGVDVAGLISNTTLSLIYESANLQNSKDYTGTANPVKLGTLNFKAKIAL